MTVAGVPRVKGTGRSASGRAAWLARSRDGPPARRERHLVAAPARDLARGLEDPVATEEVGRILPGRPAERVVLRFIIVVLLFVVVLDRPGRGMTTVDTHPLAGDLRSADRRLSSRTQAR